MIYVYKLYYIGSYDSHTIQCYINKIINKIYNIYGLCRDRERLLRRRRGAGVAGNETDYNSATNLMLCYIISFARSRHGREFFKTFVYVNVMKQLEFKL